MEELEIEERVCEPSSEEEKLYNALTEKEASNAIDCMPMNVSMCEKSEKIRASMKRAYLDVLEASSPTRERALAITKLEEACMWAIKSICSEKNV